MSASVIERKRRSAVRQTVIYVCIAMFCGLFSAIYEHFSHGVYSNAMICFFAYPLVLGALPYAAIALSKRLPLPEKRAAGVWDCGVTTLAVGSCLRGVLEIYGTTSSYTALYAPVGIALLAVGAILYFREAKARRTQPPAESRSVSV